MSTYTKSGPSNRRSKCEVDSSNSKTKFNKKTSGNRNRNYSKGKGKAKTEYHEDKVVGSDSYDNNPDWYIIDQTTADQASGFSFANFIGEPINIGTNGKSDIKNSENSVNVGATMRIGLMPSLGSVGMGLSAKTAAINQQGFKMYSRLSSVNSKNTQYLPNDITTMILAIGELIKMVNWGQRALGLAWVYNLRNRTMPKRLIEASGFDPDDLFANLAQYRISFNTLMVQANKIPFPSNINYFNKCAQVYSSVYKDEETDMSQLYVFAPDSTWLIDETGAEGTILRTHYFKGGRTGTESFSNYLIILESMINTMLTSATYNYVYADIVNFAAKNSGKMNMQMLNFATVPDDYIVLPEYNEPMLSQIHNLSVMYKPIGNGSALTYLVNYADGTSETFTNDNDVIPNVDTLSMFYKPAFAGRGDGADELAAFMSSADKILDFHTSSPNTGMRLEATRLTSGCRKVKANETGDPHTWICSDLVSADNYVSTLYVAGVEGKTSYEISHNGILFRDNIILGFSIYTLGLISQFKDKPIFYIGDVDKDEKDEVVGKVQSVFSDLDFFTTIDMDTLKRINDLSLYGLFEPNDFEYGGVISGK